MHVIMSEFTVNETIIITYTHILSLFYKISNGSTTYVSESFIK